MNDEHDAAHEPVLAAILCGDRTEVPPAVEACAVCSEQLRRLRAAATMLDDAGAEERAALADTRSTPATTREVVREDRIAELVHEGLAIRDTHRRGKLGWWLLAAVFALATALAWPRGDAEPTDRTLGAEPGEYFPTGRDVSPRDLSFRWPSGSGERYKLLLYEADEELQPWNDPILCDEPTWRPSPEYIESMRQLRDDWAWVVVTVRTPQAGGRVEERSKRKYFSFSPR